jgi:rubrerythrin
MNDSQQHANMILAMIDFLESGKWESRQTILEDKDEMLALMASEDRALRAYTHMIHDVDDPEMKTLLNILALDEDRHYRMLQYVLENFTEAATRIGAEA